MQLSKHRVITLIMWCSFGIMSGCGIFRPHSSHVLTSQKKDSASTREKIVIEKHDSIIEIERSFTQIQLDSICEGNRLKHIDMKVVNGKDTLHITTQDGKLKVQSTHAESKSVFSNTNTNKEKESTATHSDIKVEEKKETVVQYHVPRFLIIGLIISVGLNILLSYLLKKPIL
jgi:hypothetical protein